MIIQNARVYTLENGFVKRDVQIKDGYFVELQDDTKIDGIRENGADEFPETTEDKRDQEEIIDAKGNYLIPGLVDVHFHGCMGYDFSDGTPEALEAIATYELKNGITSICPATMTLSEKTLIQVCKNAAEYVKSTVYDKKCGANNGSKAALNRTGISITEESNREMGARFCGIHLEGPFISMEKKGAQNPDYIQKPEVGMFCRLQEAAEGLVRLITIAPEVEGAEEFIRSISMLKSQIGKVHISIGHTMSDYEAAARAFKLGANHVTHLYNAMPGCTHRAPGVIGAAFDAKHVMPELICDGIHVDAAAVRMTFQLFGKERMVLVSDSMRAAGMEDGNYSLGGLPVAVKGNLAILSDGTIAGSVTNLMDCMRMAVKMGIPLETAVRCAAYNPAKTIGVDDVCGSIDVGKYGDCVILDKEDLSTRMVVFGGKVVE